MNSEKVCSPHLISRPAGWTLMTKTAKGRANFQGYNYNHIASKTLLHFNDIITVVVDFI